MTKRKVTLLSGLAVSLFAIVTASVSTFAWFQAESSASITAAPSDPVNITVTKPDDYAFYCYRGNKAFDYDDNPLTPDTKLASPTGTFANDFYAITASNVSALTSLTGMVPGQSYVFCVSASGLEEDDSISLTLNSIISNDAIKQGESYHRYRYGSNSIDINIGWAINLYCMGSATASGYSSFITSNAGLTDLFDFGYDADFGTGDPVKVDPLAAAGDANKKFTLSSPIELYSNTVGESETTHYVFYKVHFVNSNESLYQEVNSSGVKQFVPVDDDDRYFRAYESTLGTYFLSGSVNGAAISDKDMDYSLSMIDTNHYQIKGVNFAANDTFDILNVDGSTRKSCASTWTGCGFTIVDGKLKVTTSGTYTVDLYLDATNSNYVTISRINDTTIDYNSNCYQGLKFALCDMTFRF